MSAYLAPTRSWRCTCCGPCCHRGTRQTGRGTWRALCNSCLASWADCSPPAPLTRRTSEVGQPCPRPHMCPCPHAPAEQAGPISASPLSCRSGSEAAGPAAGVPDGHAQQHAGRGSGGAAACAAPAGPVARPRERAHQCTAACRRPRGRTIWGGYPPRLPHALCDTQCAR